MTRKEEVTYLLRSEIAQRSIVPSVFHIVVSIWIFIYRFNCVQFPLVIQVLSVLVAIISLIRLRVSFIVKNTQYLKQQQWHWMVLCVWLNALLWSIIFSLAAIEHQQNGVDFIFAIVMITGFVSASIMSQSGVPLLYIPYQGIILLPQSGIAFFHFLKTGYFSYLGIGLICIFYFIYQFSQFKTFSRQLNQRINALLDLDVKNRELIKSQKKLTEQTEQLITSSKLAVLGEISSSMAHEINNPLAIISLGLQRLEKHFAYDTSGAVETIKKVGNATQRIAQIITSLKLSTREVKRGEMENICFATILDGEVNLCREGLMLHHITLEIPSPPKITINCQPRLISQVLRCLLKNAQDALINCPDLEARWIKINFEKTEGLQKITVINGGLKISPEVKEKLFQPFFSTKELGQGMGLGLSSSRGIMRGHGGDLYFEDSLPWTAFTMSIPYT